IKRAAAAGLSPGDDPRYDRRRRAVQRKIDAGADASAELTALAKMVASFKPTTSFLRRKLARLDAMIGRAHLSAAERARMRKASRDILRLVLADRRREASRRISNLMRQLAR
ncbi:MAG: hypothetical protein KC503_25395, partial [Myxococcales bacterium]|nr:hypothetical protein [Myxococcales bacterium]